MLWTSPLPDLAKSWESKHQVAHEVMPVAAGKLAFLQTETGRTCSVKGLGNIMNNAAGHGVGESNRSRVAESQADDDRGMPRIRGCNHGLGGHKTLARSRDTSRRQG